MTSYSPRRPAFTLFQLLILLALLVILFALMLPAVAKVREAAARTQSQNNLKQIGLALHSYHDANNRLPPGVDARGFSASAYLLPYLEQANLFQQIDFMQPMDGKANAGARALKIKLFLNPNDPIMSVSMDYGATNYLYCAGALADLDKNDGILFLDSAVRLVDITDGTSNTMMAGETLKGDCMVKATDVRRQHVQLKKDSLQGLKEDAGEKEWKDDKNIAADRCSSWMDGRFLQGTFTGTRTVNDKRPDVNCGGLGGWSGLRTLTGTSNILMGDGSVRAVGVGIKLETWKTLATRAGGEVINDKEF
jgi:prepilin-type processing-associated H-X9-DG protein